MKRYQINLLKSSDRLTGGMIYELQIAECLNSFYKVRTYDISRTIGISSRLERIIQNILIPKHNAINIRNAISTIDLVNKEKQINISVFHHFDPSTNKQKKQALLDKLLNLIYFKNLRKMDAIVVVSKYWKNFLENKGFHNLKLIYNSFEMSKYKITKAELEKFIQKYNLSKDKKLIYLGPAMGGLKGIQDGYERLRKFNYQFCATGTENYNYNGDIKILNLSYKEYIMLLYHCDLVLSLSKFREGWNRVAHEALLVKTPVIGSGTGGMKELLENAGQIICKDINKLPEYIQLVFENHEYYSHIGYDYVKGFDIQYFANCWDTLIKDLIKKKW